MNLIGKRKFWIIASAMAGGFIVTLATVKWSWWPGVNGDLAGKWIEMAKMALTFGLGVYAGKK